MHIVLLAVFLQKGVMLEVIDFSSTELYVSVNNYLFESDVNYIDIR
jgi:hypothetical protein